MGRWQPAGLTEGLWRHRRRPSTTCFASGPPPHRCATGRIAPTNPHCTPAPFRYGRRVRGSPRADRAGARKGLIGNAVTGFLPNPRSRGCPCNCKRRARCTDPDLRISHWGNLGRRVSSLDPRARRPAGEGRSMPGSRERPWHGEFRRATTKRLEPLRCRGRRHLRHLRRRHRSIACAFRQAPPSLPACGSLPC